MGYYVIKNYFYTVSTITEISLACSGSLKEKMYFIKTDIFAELPFSIRFVIKNSNTIANMLTSDN